MVALSLSGGVVWGSYRSLLLELGGVEGWSTTLISLTLD